MDQEIRTLIKEAIESIKRGDADAALLTLQRTVDPKFRSSEHAYGAYLMHNEDGPIDHIQDYFAEALGHQVAA